MRCMIAHGLWVLECQVWCIGGSWGGAGRALLLLAGLCLTHHSSHLQHMHIFLCQHTCPLNDQVSIRAVYTPSLVRCKKGGMGESLAPALPYIDA